MATHSSVLAGKIPWRCLVEAEPMQLVCLMPTIHFRPTESRKKSAKGGTVCPLPSLPAPSLVALAQPHLSLLPIT